MKKSLTRNRTADLRIRKPAEKEIRTTGGITYTLERKRITGVHLYIKPPDGDILVTAPISYPLREIEAFILDRSGWIRKHVSGFENRPLQSRMALKYETGETLYFWGRPYELLVTEEKGRTRSRLEMMPSPSFGVSDDDLLRFTVESIDELEDEWTSFGQGGQKGQILLTVPEGSSKEQREAVIRRKYKEALEEEAERILDFWSDRTGLEYTSWHTRYMKSRWGSMTIRDRKVCLNIRLAEKPVICLIYVALHEIAHAKEANHGPRFKAILSDNMPSWRSAEKVLKN